MTLAEIKNAIRVDFNDDDTFIKLCMEAAKDYIDDAIDGGYDSTNARHEMLLTAVVNSLYTNRNYSTKNNEKVSKMVRSMVSQLSDGW